MTHTKIMAEMRQQMTNQRLKMNKLKQQRDKLLIALKTTTRFLDGHISTNILFEINKLIAEVENEIITH